MKPRLVIGMVALVPLALNVAAGPPGPILMPLCTGDGQVRLVPLPGGTGPAPGAENGCCIKGCHTGQSRRRAASQPGDAA